MRSYMNFDSTLIGTMKATPSVRFDWSDALIEWRDQTAGHFARRAFSQLGRGFVIPNMGATSCIYVTRLEGAPFELLAEIYTYDPDKEAVVVYEDDTDPGALIMRRISLEIRQ